MSLTATFRVPLAPERNATRVPKFSALIADESPIVRFGIRSLLVGELGGGYFAEAETEADLRLKVAARKWRLITVGLTRGEEITREVRAQAPEALVLFLNDGTALRGKKPSARARPDIWRRVPTCRSIFEHCGKSCAGRSTSRLPVSPSCRWLRNGTRSFPNASNMF